MSEPLEVVELKFLLELARVALTDFDTIFCVSATLGMERAAIEADKENYKGNIEAVGKAFMRRWNSENDDPNKWHKLRNAFKEAHHIGTFETVASNVQFSLPPYEANDHLQVELSDNPADGLDYKLKKFLEELPRLVSTSNILWEIGLYGGLDNDDVQSVIENNPGKINQAGRDLLWKIINQSTGTLRGNILKLQKVFEAANKIAPFVNLLRKNGIEPEDLVEVGEAETVRTETGNNQILLPANSGTQADPDSLRHFDSLVPSTEQASGGRSTLGELAQEVAREGTYDYTEAFYAAANLQNPTVETIREQLRNVRLTTANGATGVTRPKSQGRPGESGYGSYQGNGRPN